MTELREEIIETPKFTLWKHYKLPEQEKIELNFNKGK